MSKETKWTQGPWIVMRGYPSGDVRYVKPVMRFDSLKKHGQNFEANAHLIAAAPELYDALDSMCAMWMTVCEMYGWDPCHMVQHVKALEKMKKARGEHE